MCLREKNRIREILINESAWEEMTCLFALSLFKVWLLTEFENRFKLNYWFIHLQ
uniref:Uncharacterized protein n=1 Tax=Klebsiella pneumoniae subsp. pneumoniae TaxID=72407 RepID=A0A7G3L3B6_KLEPN|nr:hypothetical protein ICEJAFMC_00154 [Klebsiella pneumoniae subsp. pneumoniae]